MAELVSTAGSAPITPSIPRALLTINETAEHLNCAPRTVWRLISQGAITKVQVLRAVRVSRESLDRFVQAGGVR